MLAYYAERLNGVELNGSFYRTPPESALANWAAATPAGFRFCMKAARGLTYSAEGFDRVGLAGIFGKRLAPLGEHLGPILLQFPPTRQLQCRTAGLSSRGARPPGRGRSSVTSRGSAKRPTARCARTGARWWSPTRRSGRARRCSTSDRSPISASGAATRPRRSSRGWRRSASAAASHDEVHVYLKHDPESPALAQRLLQSLALPRQAPQPPAH